MGEGFDWQTESSGEAKVGYFEVSGSIDEQVLGFKISVDDPSCMAVVDSIAELKEKQFDEIGSHSEFMLAKVFFQIVVEQLEDEIEFFFSWKVLNFFESGLCVRYQTMLG